MQYSDSWAARRHEVLTFHASQAAAQAAARVYKALYFAESGTADIVDATGDLISVPVIAGLVYPVQSKGVVTGGGTTVTNTNCIGLFDV